MLLYPPTIEGQLPPAVLKDSIVTFTIPYQINKGTNPTSITGYSIKIKNLISDKLLTTQNLNGAAADQVTFGISINDLNANLGDQFKVQVAFKDTTEQVGYFSTVGICKLIAKPELKLTLNNKDWVGVYINSQPDELIYTSQFVLKDDLGQIIEKSEVETVNYMDTAEDEEFYKTYFENTIVPGLEANREKAFTDLNLFNNWYDSVKAQIETIEISNLTKPPVEYTKEDNEQINKFGLLSSTLFSELQVCLKFTKDNLDLKQYSGQLFGTFVEKINELNTDINELNINNFSYSQNQYTNIKNNIQQIDIIIKKYKNLFHL